MTKEALLARIEKYKSEIEQVNATRNALEGAIQDCQHWLKELENGSVAS